MITNGNNMESIMDELSFGDYVEVCKKRIHDAVKKFNPPYVWVAYSGGSDSALVLEIVRRAGINVPWGVMTIDTGLSSPGHIERVKSDCARIGLQPSVFKGGGLKWWIENVRSYGYAYTPNQHVIYYRELKERAIEQSVRVVKTRYHQKVVSVTGVRRAESHRRSKTNFVYANRSARVTLNVIADLSDRKKQEYMRNVRWWRGKRTEDCMCNWHCSYTCGDDLNIDMYRAVKKIDDEMSDLGLWRYGEKPNREQIAMFHTADNDEMPDDSMCSNCIQLKMF